MLIVGSGQRQLVARVTDLVAFSEGGARSSTGLVLDIDHLLGEEPTDAAGSERLLEVRSDARPVLLRTRRALRLAEVGAGAFYRLPRLLGRHGPAPWICGLVLLEDELGVWIDLRRLATSLLE